MIVEQKDERPIAHCDEWRIVGCAAAELADIQYGYITLRIEGGRFADFVRIEETIKLPKQLKQEDQGNVE